MSLYKQQNRKKGEQRQSVEQEHFRYQTIWIVFVSDYHISIVFAVPTRPNCTVEKLSSVLKSRTSQEITLSLISLKRANNESDLCVKEGNDTCKPVDDQSITFGALESSMQYNFSVFTYTDTSNDTRLLSHASCLLSYYTREYCFLRDNYF